MCVGAILIWRRDYGAIVRQRCGLNQRIMRDAAPDGQGRGVSPGLTTTAASTSVWTLVSTGAAHQCAYPGHVNSGISEYNFLDVFFSADFVAIFKSTTVGAYFHGDFFNANRKFDVSASQASVHVRLTGKQPRRPDETGKYTSVDKSINR